MALTGSVVFKSGEVIGHQKINAAATYTKFELTKNSGSWPSQTFEITSVVVKYTKRTTGSSDITYWKLQSTSSSSGTKIGTSGSYWTGEAGSAMTNKAVATYTGNYTSNGTKFYLGIYADNTGVTNYDTGNTGITTVTTSGGGDGGQIQSGTYVYLTVNWRVTETASTFTLSPTSLEFGDSIAATLTAGQGAVSHKIRYTVGSSNSGWLDVTNLSHSYTVPSSWASELTNSTSGTLTVEVQSYNSSNTLIGTTSKTATITVPDGVVPTITAAATLVNGLNGNYIQNISQVTIAATATGTSGATIKNLNITGNNLNDLSAITEGSPVTKAATSAILTTSGTNTYTSTAVDSRGRSASTNTSINVVAYQLPAIVDIDIERWDSTNGSAAPAGTSLRLSPVFTWSNSVSGNSLTTTVYYRLKGNTTWLTDSTTTRTSGTPFVLTNTYSASSEYEIKFEIKDTASQLIGQSSSAILAVSTGSVYLYMQKQNRALGIGSYTNGNDRVYVSTDMDFWVHGSEIRDLIYPVGSIYMSVNNVSPAVFFGGTWEQIQDTFLLAAGTTYTAGDTGGSATHTHTTASHTLTIAEMPQHYHTFVDYWNTAAGSSTKRNAPAVNGDSTGIGSSERNNRGRTTGVIQSTSNMAERSGTDIGQAHSHGDTGSSSNLPPYLAVYVWKRTA